MAAGDPKQLPPVVANPAAVEVQAASAIRLCSWPKSVNEHIADQLYLLHYLPKLQVSFRKSTLTGCSSIAPSICLAEAVDTMNALLRR